MKRFVILLLSCMLLFTVPARGESASILLYGEQHAQPKILERELALWQQHYANGLRHLFVELPYFTGEWLNLWMAADDDRILDQLYADWEGTASHSLDVKAFYQAIKATCPETVFHGTDVGHQHHTTGERYLAELSSQGLQASQRYALAQECIAQGRHYYETRDGAYRENMLAENFIRAYEQLDGGRVMGIYGSAHTGLNAVDATGQTANMATQLHARYGDAIVSEDLSWLAKAIDPLGEETMTINGREYRALYFGAQDISSFAPAYSSRAFWQLENAYADFKDMPKNGNVLPYSNYPMHIEPGQVYVIDYTLSDGTVDRQYYRHDGNVWNGQSTTEQFLIP